MQNLRESVELYHRNSGTARDCWSKCLESLKRCPQWATTSICQKLQKDDFNIDDELPKQVELDVICQDTKEIRELLQFLGDCFKTGKVSSSPSAPLTMFSSSLNISVKANSELPESPGELKLKGAVAPLVVMLMTFNEIKIHRTMPIETILRPSSVFLAMRSALLEREARTQKGKNQDLDQANRFDMLHRRRLQKCNSCSNDKKTYQAHLFDPSQQEGINTDFRMELFKYIEQQLEMRLNHVASHIMNCAKEAIRGLILSPMAKRHVNKILWQSMYEMVKSDRNLLAGAINEQLVNLRPAVAELASGFVYPKELLDDMSVWDLGNRWQLSENTSPEPIVQRCIQQIRDETTNLLTKSLNTFLTKQTLEKYLLESECWEKLRDELISKIRKKLNELGLTMSPLYQEKQIYKHIKELTEEVQTMYSDLTASSLLSDFKDELLIGNFVRTAMREVNYNFGTFYAEFLREKRWIGEIASKFLENVIRANLGHFACKNLLSRIKEKSMAFIETQEEIFDFSELADTLQNVFLRVFVMRRSHHVPKQRATASFKIPRFFACGVAMRTEVLLSLKYRNLQPFAIQMALGTSNCSLQTFTDSLPSCQDLLSKPQSVDWTLPERLRLWLDVTDGLRFLHNDGITHGDLTLNSVLIREERPSARFGVLANPALWRLPGDRRQNALFKAPELARMEAESDAVGDLPVDVFAAGLLLWFLLRGDGFNVPMTARAWDMPVPDSPLNVDRLWQFCRKCCSQDPRERPSVISAQVDFENLAQPSLSTLTTRSE